MSAGMEEFERMLLRALTWAGRGPGFDPDKSLSVGKVRAHVRALYDDARRYQRIKADQTEWALHANFGNGWTRVEPHEMDEWLDTVRTGDRTHE